MNFRGGCLWRIFPDRIEPQVPGVEPIRLSGSDLHRYTFRYAKGVASLSVDGQDKIAIDLVERGLPCDCSRRPVYVGNVPKAFPWCGPFHFENNGGKSLWKAVRLQIDEPQFRRCQWAWTPADGLPNQYEVDHVLELRNDRQSPPGDFGYSGWTQLAGGDVFSVSHHRGEARLSYVTGTWLKESDFTDPPSL